MDNNMKLLAKIASRFNLIALIFKNFPVGAYPQTPPRRSVLRTLFEYPKVIIFFIAIAFSGPPQIFCLAMPMESLCFKLFISQLMFIFFHVPMLKMLQDSPPAQLQLFTSLNFLNFFFLALEV